MKRIELSIPSKFSHGRFMIGKKDENGKHSYKKLKLKPTDINYFYSLVYLYRLELLSLNKNCLEKFEVENANDAEAKPVIRHKVRKDLIDFNESISIDYYKILAMIYGKNHNSQYDGIRDFVERFENVYVETNLFGKDKNEKSKLVKIFSNLKDSNENSIMNVTMTKEYILPFIVTNEYFKMVTLNVLYLFSGQFEKLLYLLLKDYVGVSLKTKTTVISKYLGESYNQTKIGGYIEAINQTDIKVEMDQQEFGRKSDKKITIRKQKWFIDEEEECNYNLKQFIWNRCVEITEKNIANGEIVNDFDGYTKGVLKKLSKHERNNFEGEFYINNLLEKYKKALSNSVDKNEQNPIVLFMMKDNKEYLIRDDYRLITYPSVEPLELSPSSIKKFFDEHFDSELDNCVMILYIDKNHNFKLSAI
jgi:hypothetical protein